MATEVGSMNASLTLDLSNFRAGMSEAASLAAELGGQLRTALSGDVGFTRMAAEVIELVAQINNLRSAIESFQASLSVVTGADLFAQMRNNTAALPGEIASISSALIATNTSANSLNTTIQTIVSGILRAVTAAQGLNFDAFSTGTPTLDFTVALTQIEQIHTHLAAIVSLIQQVNTVDINTGEIFGEGDQAPAFHNILTILQEISQTLSTIVNQLQRCTVETSSWAASMGRVNAAAENISARVRNAGAAMRQQRSSINGAASGAKNLAGQTNKAAKNLQTSKGYAVSIKGILGGIVISQAFYQLLNIMEDVVSSAIKFSEAMQDAAVAFTYLFKDSTTSSEAFLNALKDIALQSPLDTVELASSSRKLMAMGFTAQATIPTLQILTDTAAVFSNGAGEMSDQISHIVLALGQMIASGKVSAQELRQLYNAGLPIYDLLSEGLGITKEMAKNIGHYNIDSATAVFAVLEQLQKRYGGAAAAMSKTFAGSMQIIKEALQQILSYGWANLFDTLTQKVGTLAQYLRALVKITQAYGVGGLFQAIFPESSWGVLRSFIGGLQQLGKALVQLGQILFTVFGDAIKLLVQVGSIALPVLGNIANIIMTVARAAIASSPAIKFLVTAIAALAISAIISKIVVFLAKAIWLLTGAKAAAKAIGILISALMAFGAKQPVILAVLIAIAGAFLAIVASSEKARAAIANFFRGIGTKFNDFAQSLGLGFDPGEIAMPEFNLPDLEDFSSGFEGLTDSVNDLTDATDKAGKSVKKNLQSFDEVFTIDPDAGSDASDAFAGFADILDGFGNIDYSNLFDWTGDWATDWGNITAGLGDLQETLGDTFGNIGEWASNFWKTLADSLMANPEVTGALLGAAIGGILGGLLFGKAGALIGAAIGALAGYIVGDFWHKLAEKWNLPVEAATQATIASGIGAAIGAIIGVALGGGKLGAIVGAVVGTGVAGIGTLIWKNLQSDYNISKEAGQKQFGMSFGEGIIGAITGTSKSVIAQKAAGAALSIGKALKSGLAGGLISAIASIGLSFLTDWLVGEIGIAVGKSEEEIGKGEEWASWGSTILSVIGAIIGTFIVPGLGTLIGGLLGQVLGSLLGGLAGLFQGEISEFVANIGQWFSTAWDDVKTFVANIDIGEAFRKAFDGLRTFFFETVPLWFDEAKLKINTFFTETLPNLLYEAGYSIGFALGSVAASFVTFFTETLPQAWEDFKLALDTFFNETLPQVWEDFKIALKEFFTTLGKDIKTFFTNTLPDAWNSFVKDLKTFFTETIPKAWNDFKKSLGEFFSGLLDDIVTFFTETLPREWKNFVTTVKKLGEDIITGILEGLESVVSTIWSWITNFFDGFIQGFKDAFGISSPAAEMKPIGADILSGVLEGILSIANTIGTWLTTNVFTPVTDWFKNNFSIEKFVSFGENIIQGVKNGINNLKSDLITTVSGAFTAAKNKIAEVFNIDSPSGVTTDYGEYIDQGLINGMLNKVSQLKAAATTISQTVLDYLQIDDIETPDISLMNATDKSLRSLSSWSANFLTILTSTFESVADLFDGLSGRLALASASVATIPTGINAQMGNLSAVEQLASPAKSTTTGTNEILQVLADLTDNTLSKLSDRVAMRIYEYLAPLFASLSENDQQRVLAYIGTLIADDAGLRDLNKRLSVINLQESARRG